MTIKNGIIPEANSYCFRKSVPPQTFNLVLANPQTYRPEPIQNPVEYLDGAFLQKQ